MKTEQELRQLAVDIKGGSVFTSNHVPQGEEHMLGSIFMPLVFMDEQQHKDFMEQKPSMVYEHLSEAGPRSVNGYPIFMSMKFLVEAEYDKVMAYYKELVEWEKGTTPTDNAPSV
jgi:hypothetical protein